MRKFYFPLENVRKYKLNKEDQLKNILAQEQLQLHLEKQKLVKLRQKKAEIMIEALSIHDVLLLQQAYNFLQVLEEKLGMQGKIIALQQQKVEIARENVIKAMQQRKILDNFKSKKYLDYQKKMEIFEQKQIDDLAVVRYWHKEIM